MRKIALVLAFLLVSAAFAGESITLKYNLVKPNTDPQYEWFSRFWKDVEKESKGYIKGEVYVSESLGTTADVLEQASFGEPVVADCDLAYLANYVPDFAAMMAPYLLQTPEDNLVLWNSPVFREMCSELQDQGLHLVALCYEGTRNLFTKGPITSRSDVNGLKIRCATTTMWTAVAEMLGGNPTAIPQSETYQALSQGVADGCEGVFSVFWSQKWYESLKVITKTEHIIGHTAMVMSSEVYKSLPDDARQALDRVAVKYMEEFLALSGGVQQRFLDQLIANGVVVNEIDKTEFIEAAKLIPAKFPDWTPGIYEKLSAVLEEARAGK